MTTKIVREGVLDVYIVEQKIVKSNFGYLASGFLK